MGRHPTTQRISRKSVESALFGAPCEVKGNQLPTSGDVMKYMNWVKIKEFEGGNKDWTLREVAETVAGRIIEIWTTASIPVMSKDSVVQKLLRFQARCRKTEKSCKSAREKFSQDAFSTLISVRVDVES